MKNKIYALKVWWNSFGLKSRILRRNTFKKYLTHTKFSVKKLTLVNHDPPFIWVPKSWYLEHISWNSVEYDYKLPFIILKSFNGCRIKKYYPTVKVLKFFQRKNRDSVSPPMKWLQKFPAYKYCL